ncbi:hypothetical protein SAMN04487774_10820 [Enterococcus faecalis]|uniref:hypothetical protein n=1 Tax=Enterococcus TaxID=1350 RepID=UPI00035437A6|nr:hypothetical protein [Enterococcus faecalis]EGO5193121.1 hypothetical protein [Enterococcus faecalis]EGO8407738.1 hypothetical protein [Enterococcus faecalis]EGO8626987.1 hypothetical protein [Enterococcus faecalis]EIQ7148815.1 hypothetical protein [Enterococcus faecalis]EJR9797947.1 hypothetical protein [Enterococcus faecalis]
MKLNFDEIKEILLCYPEGISLDDLLIIMDMDVINQNRISVISILKWHDEIKKVYTTEFGRIKTKYKINFD